MGKSVNRLNGIPSGLSDSIGQVANAQRAYLAQIGIRLSFRRRRSQYNNVKLERHTRSPLWTLKCSNADCHCVVFVEEKLHQLQTEEMTEKLKDLRLRRSMTLREFFRQFDNLVRIIDDIADSDMTDKHKCVRMTNCVRLSMVELRKNGGREFNSVVQLSLINI